MTSIKEFFGFVLSRKGEIISLILEHIQLTIMAVLLAIVVGVPLGILITRKRKLATPLIGIANVIQSIPSLALLGFLIPVMGIGSKPAVFMVFLYSLLPILKNTYTAIMNINPDMLEAAKAMGMRRKDMLFMVELPLSLPIIMTGIRISAVTAVGLMTIAAFVGAGGLGYMVFSGVQTVNNNMILAGAIPACILALLMDLVIGKVEKLVTPAGVSSTNVGNSNKKDKRILGIIAGVLVVIIAFGFSKSYFGSKNKIVVASKNYNEQLILGNMISTLIEKNTDLEVERKLNLGGSSIIINALKAKEVDLYVEYTGTALISIMKHENIKDKNKAYNVVSDYFKENLGIMWLKPLGFNNTYTLAVTQDTANKYNLNTYSDLSKVSEKLTLGSTIEFANRQDGYLGVKDAYGMNFKDVKAIDGGLRYTSLVNNSAQVVDAFSTDGLLESLNLKVLEDDKGFFPPYYSVPIIREEVLEKHPELEAVINKLAGQISDKDMGKLNYKVDKDGEDPRKVAEDFLRERGLI
ncbi:periplasmic glycine betaine/choline-binding (lipo)protein of an ABC-type transport system (osmoprotectant binding protein) [Clostridium putrefaciens]|uniref:Periplasmic glycine betaine/choline-binding (Lipo)protein of an ABC-type transport system (Osmoprotectant binding protein) n=1 Tax=Clostridium putrefaciens TaxID=99675 RepID=A0A381J6M1_9CLOT|nr:glycine betaine ABC transporter substrate-binding protein [Clostridium putrefaciens]SUY46633.1 periplasmic glycine betaine/choline-binding (lipo)protein of an ABC-type transport system (osmoprotectant binding protein) [Clostridium putrefaciens]